MATPLHHMPVQDNSRALPLQPHQWIEDHNVRAAASVTAQSISSTNRNFTTTIESTTKTDQAMLHSESNRQIELKLQETSSLESEASRQLASTQEELGRLEISMAETEAALQSKNTPIQRVDEWLARRAERPQSEAIRDGVEMAIDALSKALRESVVLLQSTLAAQASEAKRLASAAAALSADIADKQAAIDIDSTTRSIEHARSGSRQEWQYASKGPVVAPEWRGSTTSICAAARQVVAVSARLRGKAAQVVVECARTEAAAKKELLRVHALSINRLRATVAESQQQIAQLDDALAELGRIKASAEAAMAEKEDACAVTTDRLNTRNQRPDRERVHDQAQMALQNELRSLTSAAHELARQIQRCSDDEHRLASAKAKVEEDLANKEAFLQIEEELLSIDIPLGA